MTGEVLEFFPICILLDLSKPSLRFHQKQVGIVPPLNSAATYSKGCISVLK